MTLAEYIILFALVLILGAGIPGPGDAALIGAGTLAGEGKLNVGILLATAAAAWMLGSVIGYQVGQARGAPDARPPGTNRGTAPETAGQRRPCLRPSYLRGVHDDAGVRVRDLPGAVPGVRARGGRESVGWSSLRCVIGPRLERHAHFRRSAWPLVSVPADTLPAQIRVFCALKGTPWRGSRSWSAGGGSGSVPVSVSACFHPAGLWYEVADQPVPGPRSVLSEPGVRFPGPPGALRRPRGRH